jgi:putative Mg2+ transporter-C (MgtC) family protein
MNAQLGWGEVALRLAATVVAGVLVGLNRSERGRAAGLRTTMLVCLAASVSMLQVNLLLPTRERESDSFVMLDLMRLPLGVLTGMGFIGAGAILRRGDVAVGVTTAATLWYVTILGLCFGGGQLILGGASLAIGLLILSALKQWESRLLQDHRGVLAVESSLGGPTEDEILDDIRARGFSVKSAEVCYDKADERWILRCDVKWRARASDPRRIPVKEWSERPGVRKVDWRPLELPEAGG